MNPLAHQGKWECVFLIFTFFSPSRFVPVTVYTPFASDLAPKTGPREQEWPGPIVITEYMAVQGHPEGAMHPELCSNNALSRVPSEEGHFSSE
jgi:hypothetical protein